MLRRLVINFHRVAPQIVLVRGGGRTTAQAGGLVGSTRRPGDARQGRVLFLSGLKAAEKSIVSGVGQVPIGHLLKGLLAIEQMVKTHRWPGLSQACPVEPFVRVKSF
ncbi:hypothetical protein D9M69_628940 [compost metagenome]